MRYYVDSLSGNDTEGNGSNQFPYATLEAVYENNVIIGDVIIIINSGTYNLKPALIKSLLKETNLTLRGKGVSTILNILEGANNWDAIGDETTCIRFEKLTLDATNMPLYQVIVKPSTYNKYDYYYWKLKCELFFENVLFKNFKHTDNTSANGYWTDSSSLYYFFYPTYNHITVNNCTSYFTPYQLVLSLNTSGTPNKYHTVSTMQNLFYHGDTPPKPDPDVAPNPDIEEKTYYTVKIRNSFGAFGSNSSSWAENQNNIIINSPTASLVDEEYYILNETTNLAEVGIYFGRLPWGIIPYMLCMGGDYYSLNEQYYNKELKAYTPIPIEDIKNNGFNKYAAFDYESLLHDIYNFDEESFVPIEKFNDFRLIMAKDSVINLNAIKYNTGLLVQRFDVSTSIAKKIINFSPSYSLMNTDGIKIIFSFNEGKDWHTYVDGRFILLENCTIPLKDYINMSDEEKINFNLAKDILLTHGLNISELVKIDFNQIKFQKIRFAYLFNQDNYYEKSFLQNMVLEYDENDNYVVLTDNEYDLEVFDKTIKITSNIFNSKIKAVVIM